MTVMHKAQGRENSWGSVPWAEKSHSKLVSEPGLEFGSVLSLTGRNAQWFWWSGSVRIVVFTALSDPT